MSRLLPHCTLKGRVVYERKTHYFNQKDLERVAWAVFFRLPHNRTIVKEALYRASTYFLRIILDIFGVGFFTDVVYGWLTQTVADLLGKAGELLGIEYQRSMALGIATTLSSFNEQIHVGPENYA